MRQLIVLQPNESKTASFSFTPVEARSHTVEVDGLSGQFVALEPEYIQRIEYSCPPSREGERINLVLQALLYSRLYVYRASFVSPELKVDEVLYVKLGSQVGYLPIYYSRGYLRGEIWADNCKNPVPADGEYHPPATMSGYFDIKVYEVDDPDLPQSVRQMVYEMELMAIVTS